MVGSFRIGRVIHKKLIREVDRNEDYQTHFRVHDGGNYMRLLLYDAYNRDKRFFEYQGGSELIYFFDEDDATTRMPTCLAPNGAGTRSTPAISKRLPVLIMFI